MIIIFPDNNKEERVYAAKVLIGAILEIPFEYSYSSQKNTVILLSNGHKAIIEDHFFNNYPAPNSYQILSAIPSGVTFSRRNFNPFLVEKDLPVLYGTDAFKIEEGNFYCDCDIFAATFFCLTRWEEAVNSTRDKHGRFPSSASNASKNGYLQRPIVNEMAEMLWNILKHLGEPLSKASKNFELFLTHDIDQIYLWPNTYSFIKKTGGDLLKRHNLAEALLNCRSFFANKILGQADPYDTYDYLMDISERHGLTSHFYFLAGGTTKFDNDMGRQLNMARPIMERITARGHKIGVHPSYRTATNEAAFSQEIKQFRNISPQEVEQGRQHFLRFEVGKTWLFWERCGLSLDSTLGYPEQSGFRCGTCTPFPVFDIFERRQLNLIEVPLTAMDATYPIYQNAKPSEMEEDLLNLLAIVKKYTGTFTLLWHNTSFHVPEYQAFAPIYERFLKAATASS